MGSYTAQLQDCLYLNFAVHAPEVERLLPPGVTLDSRQHRGKTWGFFSVLLYRCEKLYSQNIGWPSLNFEGAEIRLYVKDGDETPAIYLLRYYFPSFTGWLLSLTAGLPVRNMDLDYPTSVNPGGIFRWSLEGQGAGNIRGEINETGGPEGQLVNYFDSTSAAYDFFERRPVIYYGATSEKVHRLKSTGTGSSHYPVSIESWELGFTATDLERHQFPEAVSSCYFSPNLKLTLVGPEKVDISRLVNI